MGPAGPAVAELQPAAAPVNLHTEVADAEQLLEELDACGVSGVLPVACQTTTFFAARMLTAAPHFFSGIKD